MGTMLKIVHSLTVPFVFVLVVLFTLGPSFLPGELGNRAWGDADGDGVTDANDNCADTPSGASVGANGCPTPGATLHNVDSSFFGNATAILRSDVFIRPPGGAVSPIQIQPPGVVDPDPVEFGERVILNPAFQTTEPVIQVPASTFQGMLQQLGVDGNVVQPGGTYVPGDNTADAVAAAVRQMVAEAKAAKAGITSDVLNPGVQIQGNTQFFTPPNLDQNIRSGTNFSP